MVQFKLNGQKYYRTDVEDAEGKRVISLRQKLVKNYTIRKWRHWRRLTTSHSVKNPPTVAEHCEKWLFMQSVHIRNTTLTDYTSKVLATYIKELGQKEDGRSNIGRHPGCACSGFKEIRIRV